jgi:hypothetical protein
LLKSEKKWLETVGDGEGRGGGRGQNRNFHCNQKIFRKILPQEIVCSVIHIKVKDLQIILLKLFFILERIFLIEYNISKKNLKVFKKRKHYF